MSVGKLGKRRQVVIPKEICDELDLHEGDFVELARRGNTVVVKPKKLVDADELLTPADEASIRRGEAQLKRGEGIPLDEVRRRLKL